MISKMVELTPQPLAESIKHAVPAAKPEQVGSQTPVEVVVISEHEQGGSTCCGSCS